MSEKCQRCGEDGEDRRTLNMSCFYDMSELRIPFTEEVLFSADMKDLRKAKDPVTIELSGGHKLNIAPGSVFCDGELHPTTIYTLRVCKSCRGKWLSAIKSWFQYKAEVEEDVSCGSGIFVRRKGVIVEITEEEWYRDHLGQLPVRVRKS